MEFTYKNVLIYGYASSGKQVEKILKDKKINYKIFDDDIKISGGLFLSKLNKNNLSQFDCIIISPAISIYNKNIVLAEKLGIKVISELEFGYLFCNSKIIAVTGTNGKSSVCTHLYNIISSAGYKCDLVGNIGKPLSSCYKKKFDYLIVEVSSFQLEATDKFLPDIGVILNIEQDHLDRHKNMSNYIFTKKGLFKNCSKDHIAVLNYDDEVLNNMQHELTNTVVMFSTKSQIDGVHLKDNNVYLTTGQNTQQLDIKITNDNVIFENLLAVVQVCLQLDIELDLIENEFNKKFTYEHRTENVATINNVTYINDSKSTNIHSTNNAINNIDGQINLILGGVNKNLDFNHFFQNLNSKVVNVVCYGKAGRYLKKCAKKNNVIIQSFKNLDLCFDYVKSIANDNQYVLFSPACASFDLFNNYKERGDYFKKLVLQLEG